jgi:hypothetical protein
MRRERGADAAARSGASGGDDAEVGDPDADALADGAAFDVFPAPASLLDDLVADEEDGDAARLRGRPGAPRAFLLCPPADALAARLGGAAVNASDVDPRAAFPHGVLALRVSIVVDDDLIESLLEESGAFGGGYEEEADAGAGDDEAEEEGRARRAARVLPGDLTRDERLLSDVIRALHATRDVESYAESETAQEEGKAAASAREEVALGADAAL